jgi:polar amino acid transport system permease protein
LIVSTVLELLPELLRGALVTLEVTAMAAVVAIALAFVVGLARLTRFTPVRVLATAYVEILRGTSALVQLFYLFFILPLLGISINPLATAVIGLGLNFSAYGSEIVRTAILNIDRGQWEAAKALDMPAILSLRRIILPQALATMLPPFGNQLVELLKATSLVSLITLTDLTFAGSRLITSTGRPAEIWALVLVLYFVMAFPLSRLVRRLETHLTVFRGSTRP